jgi:PPOX class probable F420-dependent enzyme
MSTRERLTDAEAAFVQAQRAGRLATADERGTPHVVPVCYAYDGARFYTPLDEKPKRASDRALRRVRNITTRGEASLVIDRYDDDWSRLGYVLVTGRAELIEPGESGHAGALALLRARYPQYRAMALESRPVIALTPTSIVSWGPAVDAAGGADGEASPPNATSANTWLEPGRGVDFVPVARGRRSVRVYQDRPVPREALDIMIEAARWAPSPHGTQPWRFVVLTRPEAKRSLAEAMGAEWERTLAMDREPPHVVALRLAKSRERIERAPALILACLYLEDLDRYPDAERQRAEEVMAIQSLGAALQNTLLAAYTLGLDTGWMCAPLFCPDTVRAALDLDASLIPHALVTVGYLAQEPKRRTHRAAGELVIRFD